MDNIAANGVNVAWVVGVLGVVSKKIKKHTLTSKAKDWWLLA